MIFDFEKSKKVIDNELQKFNNIFLTSFVAHDDLLNNALTYLMPQKGKQIRPTIVILAAKLCGNITDDTYLIAASYELLHHASLIHDDVIDNSNQRRNKPSLNKIFDNKVSVLVGDYLITKSFNYIYLTKNIEQIGLLQKLSADVIKGELLQQQYSHSILKEEEYYSVIKNKTAALFATCLKSGALSAGGNEKQQDILYQIGENLGMCFQIKDDIFDYSANAKIGKPIFNDITEGKVTLPLLHSVRFADEKEKIQVINILNKDNIGVEYKTFIYNIINKYKGIEYSVEKMIEFRDLALKGLENFDNSEYKSFLAEIINFAANRNL